MGPGARDASGRCGQMKGKRSSSNVRCRFGGGEKRTVGARAGRGWCDGCLGEQEHQWPWRASKGFLLQMLCARTPATLLLDLSVAPSRTRMWRWRLCRVRRGAGKAKLKRSFAPWATPQPRRRACRQRGAQSRQWVECSAGEWSAPFRALQLSTAAAGAGEAALCSSRRREFLNPHVPRGLALRLVRRPFILSKRQSHGRQLERRRVT